MCVDTHAGQAASIVSQRRGAGRCFSQGRRWRDTSRRRRRLKVDAMWMWMMWMMWMILLILVSPTNAILVNFENCLSENVIHSEPLQLQFIPLDVDVSFGLQDSLHPLNITVYGNVSGTADQSSSYPSPDSSQWFNASNTEGKIEDLNASNNKYSTLLTNVDVLNFSPYSDASRFCDSVLQGSCPLGPVFYTNASNLSTLRAFSIQHDMESSFRFATFSSQLVVKSGDAAATTLGCISVDITPDLGSSLKSALAYIPLVILILVGIATVTAAIYSPWGTTDPFRWTSNYGRDEDVIRLVTPGFGDCLQYIQFVVLTGALTLDYPGYYQPVVSQAAWSALMFNQSLVNPGLGRNPVVDGVYAVNGTYGLNLLEQYVGMSAGSDIWPGMMVWLVVIVVAVTLLIQLAFGFRWLYHELANVPEEDLRSKNLPFTIGSIVRIVFNFLFLPLISLSFFQLVIARDSPAYSVALAVVVILILIAFALWTIRLIGKTRPKSYLFDDLSTVLLYGPLYNTFCDDAAAFAVVPLLISFARGVAVGALQPSGIAQIVLLAICEVVFVLTLVAFRPFPSPTSMNLYHTFFSIIRFLTILLSVTFVPSLNVSEAARGWIGYVILFLHAIVLVFGFFLNALQTLIEVIARLAGAGGYQGSATRGGLVRVFGMRQLSRRVPGRDVGTRQSMGSEAAMLTHAEERYSSQYEGSRPRSLSGNSALLLNRAAASDGRVSAAFESGSAGRSHSRANSSGMYTPTTPGGTFQGQTTGSNSPKSGPLYGLQPHDPYYRPPRPRRKTLDTAAKGSSSNAQREGSDDDEGPVSGRATPVPAYIPAPKDDLDIDDPRPARKDYAVREVDFYYRVRGPPLSHTGTRKLKTGPADPTGPVSSATGWFRNLFQGKTKEKGKGFEVVRSARAPPPGLLGEAEDFHEPYRDEPEGRNQPEQQEGEHNEPPTIPEVDPVGDIELPSRMGSQRSQAPSITLDPAPSIPRRSSKRNSVSVDQEMEDVSQGSLPAVAEAVTRESRVAEPAGLQPSPSTRLPFSSSSSTSRDRGFSVASTAQSSSSSHQMGRSGSGRTRDRPSSMGYVAQYRARDNIHEPSPDEPSFTGSAAELVDGSEHNDDR